MYSASAGIPRKYILRYRHAPSISTSLVFKSSSSGRAKTTPIMSSSTPISAESMHEVCTVSSVSRSLREPRYIAVRAFMPLPMPMRKPVNRNTSVAVEPTAPSASAPANCPTTAISDILKST